jgi:hypothetical protein
VFKIELEPAERTAVREPECPVCRETLFDHEDVYEDILKAASRRPVPDPYIATELASVKPCSKDLQPAKDRILPSHA